jgi:hypothetical protein
VGSARFAGLGIPTPNLGSILGVGELDDVDLPVAKSYVGIARDLDPYENPTVFTGQHYPRADEQTPLQLMGQDTVLYEQLGVRYVVTRSGENPFKGIRHVDLAYHDARFWIWKLPNVRPFARVPGCTVVTRSNGDDDVTCRHHSVLLVNQLYFPGWSASVNGAGVAVQNHGGFQAIDVPQGRSVVALTFLPPDVPEAAVAALVAFLALLVPWELVATRRRRRLAETATIVGMAERFRRLGRDRSAPDADRGAPDPPTGAIVIGDLDLEEPGDPTTSTPAVVAARPLDELDDADGPPTSAVPVAAGERPDPPTLGVELGTPSEP